MSYGEIEILLVEDNPADVELTLHALRANKLANHVHIAHDGEQALNFLLCQGEYADRDPSNQPRLVLLDLKIPKISGIEVLKAMKANPATRPIPVVILTSSKEASDTSGCYQLGVNSYIQKPVNFEEFQQTAGQLGLYWLLVNTPPPAGAFQPQE
jgi:two-component system, response regulator